jgi:hypothetical protein
MAILIGRDHTESAAPHDLPSISIDILQGYQSRAVSVVNRFTL